MGDSTQAALQLILRVSLLRGSEFDSYPMQLNGSLPCMGRFPYYQAYCLIFSIIA